MNCLVTSSPSVGGRQSFSMSSPPKTGPSVEPSPLPTAKNALATRDDAPRHVTNEQFQAMIPAHFVQPAEQSAPSSSVVINVKQPDAVALGGTLSEFAFPEPPTQLGKVTETITKSTLTETIVTRVTNNRLGALPIIIEVLFHSSTFTTSPDNATVRAPLTFSTRFISRT